MAATARADYDGVVQREAPMPGEAIVIADTAGAIRMFSSGAENLLGHDAASVVGRKLDVLVPAEYREHHWRGFHAAMQSDDLKIDRASANVPIARRDGAVAREAVRLLVLRDAKQSIVGAVAIFVGDDPSSSLPRL
jgi:PAS domain S-box-containing protein